MYSSKGYKRTTYNKLLPTFVSCSCRFSGAHSLECVCILELARVFILNEQSKQHCMSGNIAYLPHVDGNLTALADDGR